MQPSRFLLVLAFALVSQVASAGDWRVRDVKELAATCQTARPGDEIVLADGRWNDASLLFQAEGTAEKPITLRAENPGRVELTGRSQLRIAGQHLVVDGLYFRGAWQDGELITFRRDSKQLSHHCRLTNCAIVDCNPPDPKTEGKWISIYGTHNRVDHCYIAGKATKGTTLVVWVTEEPSEHLIDRNYFGPRPELKANGGETIRIGTSEVSMNASRTIVSANYFEECNGEAEIISNKSCDNFYHGNTFVRCQGALTLRHGNRATVSANFFLGQHTKRTGGVRVIGEDHRVFNNYFAELTGDASRSAVSLMAGVPNSPPSGYLQVKRALVAFNTMVDCQHNLVLGLADKDSDNRLPPEECTIANNLMLARSGPIIEERTPLIRPTWQGNIMFGAELGIAPNSGIRMVDPQMALAKDGLWHPAAKGPAHRSAVGLFAFIDTDIDGQPRGELKDVGCDQASTIAITNRPLTPADVGPGWWPKKD